MLKRAKQLLVLILVLVIFGAVLYVCLKEDSDGHKPLSSRHHVLEHAAKDWRATAYPGGLQAPMSPTDFNQPQNKMGNIMAKAFNDDLNDDGISEDPMDEFEEESMRDQIEKAYRRSMDYCNPVDQKTRVDEGNVSQSYKLISVYAVIRHGDRSPMYKLPNQDSPKLSCLLDTSQSVKYRDILESFFKHITIVGHQIKHNHIFGLYPHQKSCMGAQLTGRGAIQHLVNSDRLKEVYVKTHGLLSKTQFQEQIVVKTTDYSRTYQSAIAFLHGILPEPGLQKLKIKVTDNVLFCDERDSGVSCNCPVINRLKEYAKKEETKMKSSVTSDLMNTIRREIGDIYGLNSQQHPWVGSIIEVLMGYVCHDLPLPCSRSASGRRSSKGRHNCIQFPLIGKMWDYLDARGEILLSGHADQKYNLLLVYPLLREIANAMQNVTVGQTNTRLTLYSGHDLTLRPLTKALGISDGRWPPYASRLLFELYSSSSDNKYYIKVIYNGEDRTRNLKFCEENDLTDGLCPLTNFMDFAFHEIYRTFRKQSYKDICYG